MAGNDNNPGTNSATNFGGASVFNIQWQWGQHVELAFNPDQDTLDFGWFASKSFSLSEINGSLVISIPSNQQSYTLKNVTLADLRADNIIAKDSQTQAFWAQTLSQNSGTEPDPSPNPEPEPGIEASDTPATPSMPNADIVGSFTMGWAWNQNAKVTFDHQTDTINFGWFGPDNFSVQQINGSVVISVTGNQQSYTLEGVRLEDLGAQNITALDSGTKAAYFTAK